MTYPGGTSRVVVPELAVNAALRVPEWIRSRLRVHIWGSPTRGAFD